MKVRPRADEVSVAQGFSPVEGFAPVAQGFSPASCATVQRALATLGLLLQQDPRLPSVVGIMTGERLRASWWSHPKAHAIFRCTRHLEEHPGVLVSRLIAGKVTYVHRRLWPAFVGVATGRDAWQTRGLSPAARALLARVRRTGSHRATGPAARELQGRLLVHAEEVHTEAGRHELVLRSWPSWLRAARVKPLPPAAARAALERAVAGMGGDPALLPWNRFGSRKRRRLLIGDWGLRTAD